MVSTIKSSAIVVVLSLIIPHCLAQQSPDKWQCLLKAEKYKRRKNIGATLAATGGVLLIAGAIILNNSSITNYPAVIGPSRTVTTGNTRAGLTIFLAGIASIGTGIPMWISGAHKQKRYQQRFNDFSLILNVSPQGNGLKLTYRF